MEPGTLTTLLVYNPWIEKPARWDKAVRKHLPQALGNPYIKRLADHSQDWPQTGKINIVIGPRQCGKSTLIWNTLSNLKKSTIYINCNELSFVEWCKSPAMFWDDLNTVVKHPEVIFFEEIQHVENAGFFLKGLIDLHEDLTVFATGSSSFHLRDKIPESLAGRTIRLRLLPFSLKEWAYNETGLPSSLLFNKLEKESHRMLVYGSYPEACFSDKAEFVLNSLVESFVIRDASDTFQIRYPAKFRKLLGLMASQTGKLVNFSHWASVCGIDIKTAVNYASILEENHVIRLLPPYVGGKRSEIKNSPKVFFLDNGIRNLLVSQFNNFEMRADRELLFENWIFSEISKNMGINDLFYFWRSKSGAEVNFVMQGQKGLIGYEVNAVPMKQPKLARASRSFINAYTPSQFYVVNLNLRHEEVMDKTQIRWLTHMDLVDVL